MSPGGMGGSCAANDSDNSRRRPQFIECALVSCRLRRVAREVPLHTGRQSRKWRNVNGILPLMLLPFLFPSSSAVDIVPDLQARFVGYTKASIVTKFDELEAATINVAEWKGFTNDAGDLAWGASYLLNAYLDMYEATKDSRYLRNFVGIADTLSGKTDASRRIPDYKGRCRVGWGSVTFSNHRERIVFLVHTGMIVYPLVRFAAIAPPLQFSTKAEIYRKLAESALNEFNAQWRTSKGGTGFYVTEDDQPSSESLHSDTPVPVNMQLAAGRAFVLLWKVTGKCVYRERSAALARYFRGHLIMDRSGGYVWNYWYPGVGLRSPSPEDLSHGAIDIDFAVLAAHNNLVFSSRDLQRFTVTFFRLINGTRQGDTADLDATGRWLSLSEESCKIYDALLPSLMARTGLQQSQVLLGIAGLAKYADRCLPD